MVDIEKLDPEIKEKVYRPSAEETAKTVNVIFDNGPPQEEEEERTIEVDVNGTD